MAAASTTSVNLPPVSMFQATPLYGPMPDGTIVPGLIRPVLVPALDDGIFLVTQGTAFRLERIAAQFYGVPEAWWVLAQVNNVRDPWSDVPQNTRLRIPTRARLLAASILTS